MTPPHPTFELALIGGPASRTFTCFVPDGAGGRVAEHTFEWRTDSTALALGLGELARAARSDTPPVNDLHIRFGQRLFETVFAGPVGQLWQERLKDLGPRRQPLRVVVRIDPQTAHPLLNLPWEYLHDGSDFLALSWRTPLSRLPWGLLANPLPLLTEPLRMLVVIAAPLGLSQNMVLNTAREEDLILSATSAARRTGQLEIEFTPNGSPESLETALREFDPHLLHFTGHGVFVSEKDTGFLLMETPDGHKHQVPNAEFAQLLVRRGKSLRLVFLSACQSAVAPQQDGYSDLAPRLLAAGVPAVVAMQYSVLNKSAMEFGGAFYRGLVEGDMVDATLTEARGLLARESLNRVDFAVPVLFLADPACLQVDVAALSAAKPQAPVDLTGVSRAQNFVGRSAELRELATNLEPEHGPWRAAVVYGLGGMGKTVLAARLAERMASHLDGVKSLRMTPSTTARDVLNQIAGFLLVNQIALDHPGISKLNKVKDEPLPLENKVAVLAEILTARRLLLLFDNCEDILPQAQAVSRESTKEPAQLRAGTDPDLLKLFRLLVETVPGPSRFLFTSRVDFSPLEPGRLSGAVGHLPLSEMGFRDAVYLMETLPPLNELPVAALFSPEKVPSEGSEIRVQPLSMRDLHARLGGHPYTLNLFAEHARRASVQDVLKDLGDVRQEMLEFTLLDRAAAQLPERAALLLRRAAVFEEPVPLEGLAFLLGDERDAMPEVTSEAQALLEWGLLAHPPGTADSMVHTLVRDWARSQWTPEERLALLRRAAQYWLVVGRDSSNLEHLLNSRRYLFQAGDYEQADEIVQLAWDHLLRWGEIELVLHLLDESVRTVKGNSRAVARGNLATVYQALGEYTSACKVYEEVLAEFQAAGDRGNVATALHQLGILHDLQGEYPQARQRYEESLAIEQELGRRAGVASSLHELGMLHQQQGEYPQARQRYEESLAITKELGDRVGVARSLHQLGILHDLQGEYPQARQCYEESLTIFKELGARADVASSLGELGILQEQQGEYPQARQRCEESLAIFTELGDRVGIATGLHQLGVLHQNQGEYPQARQRYEESLAIKQELGDRDGVARSLHQLGVLLENEGRLAEAVTYTARAFATLQQLGSPDQQIAGRTLARLREKMGPEAFETALSTTEAGSWDDPADAPSNAMTPDQVLQVVMDNTIAVLTRAPEKKSEWRGALEELRGQAQAQEMEDFAVFLSLLCQLVEGAKCGFLTPRVPAEFCEAWQAILHGVSGETRGE